MKILADMVVSIRTVESLRASGHDVDHLRERGLERLEDSAILSLARGAVVSVDDSRYRIRHRPIP